MTTTSTTTNASATIPQSGEFEVPLSGYGKIGNTLKEDERLTHVSLGTPMGELFRRYWLPICLSEELKDLPKRVRILGEDLVAFRNRRGQVGVLDAHCAHRGTSLEYGRIEEEGIRCCYHGWLFANDGRCLQQPCEPSGSNYYREVFQPAYPAQEYGGLVFIYMGPPDKQPLLPRYDSIEEPGTLQIAYRNTSRGTIANCNFLQILDNLMDPMHTAILHSTISTTQFTEVYAAIPKIEFQETEMGMMYIRKSLLPNGRTFVRVQEIFMPNVNAVAEALVRDGPHVQKAPYIGFWVPVDDTHSMAFRIEALRVVNGEPIPSSLANAPVGRSTAGGAPRTCYEDTQREPDDCEAQVSQRPIAIHTLEHKATSDAGIVMYRRLLRDALRRMDQGQEPKGLVRDSSKQRIEVIARNEIIKAADE